MRAVSQRPKQPWARLVAGLIGGLAATIAMSKFQSAWNAATLRMAQSAKYLETRAGRPETQPTDVETIRILAKRIANLGGFEFSSVATPKAAVVLHYGIGTAGGCLYCFLMNAVYPRFQKEHRLLAGALFGTALFLFADLAVLPLMGFPNKGPQSPLGTRLYGISSHVIYGATAAEAFNFVTQLPLTKASYSSFR